MVAQRDAMLEERGRRPPSGTVDGSVEDRLANLDTRKRLVLARM